MNGKISIGDIVRIKENNETKYFSNLYGIKFIVTNVGGESSLLELNKLKGRRKHTFYFPSIDYFEKI